MRIGINALFIRPGKLGGGEINFRNLFDAIARLDRSNSYFVFVDKRYLNDFSFENSNISLVGCNLVWSFRPFRACWEQFIIPFKLRKYKIDIVHSFSQTGLLFAPCKSIMTIHDLQHHYYPTNFSLVKRLYLRLLMYLTAKRSNKIITISNNSSKDILNLLKVPENKIEVIYEGSRFNNNLTTISDEDRSGICEKYHLDTKYILSVASMLPHKNLERLIWAFSLLSLNEDYHLVLAGLKMKSFPSIRKAITSSGLSENRVKLLDYIPDSDLPALYSMADLFVFPSLFEGFGLPPLEAMTFGCPVIAADSTSIPEVVGDAALLADPFSSRDLADKMTTVLTNKQLRDKLIQKGLERAKYFSWEKSAYKILSIYEDTLNQSN